MSPSPSRRPASWPCCRTPSAPSTSGPRDREGAEDIARRLTPAVIRIPARAGAEGRLFGSVTSADIAEAVTAQTGITLDRRRVHLDDPIKSIGSHEIAVRLHTDVEVRL